MSDKIENKKAHEIEAMVHSVTKRQVALSLQVAVIFIILIVGLPLFNTYMPETAKISVFGFSLTWFILGVCFFPLSWLLSTYFVRTSDRIEAETVAMHKGETE